MGTNILFLLFIKSTTVKNKFNGLTPRPYIPAHFDVVLFFNLCINIDEQHEYIY